MKLVRTVCIALVLSSAPVLAQPDKQAPAEVTPMEAQRWMELFDRVVDTVVVHRQDCGKMATGLNGLIDANQQTIAMARDARAKGKRLPISIQQKMLDGMKTMVGALDRCGRDEGVANAFRRLDLGSHKVPQ